MLENVPALEVTKLVSEDEFHLGRIRTQRLQEVGKDHHEIAASMPGGKRIERAAGLHDIKCGNLRHAQPRADFPEGGVEFGYLMFGHLDRFRAETGGHESV